MIVGFFLTFVAGLLGPVVALLPSDHLGLPGASVALDTSWVVQMWQVDQLVPFLGPLRAYAAALGLFSLFLTFRLAAWVWTKIRG